MRVTQKQIISCAAGSVNTRIIDGTPFYAITSELFT